MTDDQTTALVEKVEKGTETIDSWAERFAASAEVQMAVELLSLFAGVPLVGQYLSKKLSVLGARVTGQRADDFRQGLHDRLRLLEESAIRHEYLESEDFFQVFSSCLARTILTRKQTKRQRFGRFVAGTLVRPLSYDRTEQLDNLHESLTDWEFAVSYVFFLHQRGELSRKPILLAEELSSDLWSMNQRPIPTVEMQRREGLRPLGEITGIPHDHLPGILRQAIRKGALESTMDAELAESQTPTAEFLELCELLGDDVRIRSEDPSESSS